MMEVFCPDCGAESTLTPENWRCACGGAWEIVPPVKFDPSLIDDSRRSIWRYRRLFGLPFDEPLLTLGVGGTPLLPVEIEGREIRVKPEYISPTASFKDRGVEVMINILAHQEVTRVAEDSSGNAGASVAAYAARAGMQAEIFVPAHTSPAKQAQIAVYSAHVNPIPGPRVNAKLAAIKALEQGITFASHAYHPGFLLGMQSEAYEVWEQFDRRAPDWYVFPVGQGGHLLGVWMGFKRLLAAGLIDRLPKIVAVQAGLLAPVCEAFAAGMDHVPAMEPAGTSLAEGIAIAEPVRGRRILQALRESQGTCVAVEEADILRAREVMAGRGFYIEPTSATVVAALKTIFKLAGRDETIVVSLTGSGLKGSPVLS